MTSSLSSVVSNLVRASMGTSVPSTVPDDDLDRHVAELIVREAKKKAERYSQQGIRAYISNNVSDSNAPKTNKRFLTSIIKSTDDHNKTLLKAQALAAQEVKREREEQERKQRRARAEEAADAERRRRSGKGTKHKRYGNEESWDRWDGRTAERKKVSRNWENWDGEDEDDDSRDGRRSRKRCRTRSPLRSRSRDRKQQGTSRNSHAEHREAEVDDRHRRYRRDRSRSISPRRNDSRDESRERGDAKSRKHKRRRTKERTHRHSRLSDSHSQSPLRHSRSRSPYLPEDSKSRKRKRSGSPKYALDDIRTPADGRSSSALSDIKEDTEVKYKSRDHLSVEPETSTSKNTTHQGSSGRSPLPPTSRSPSPGPQLPTIQLPSKMDRYFEESYDPRLDVATLTAPKVPATGLIDNAEFEGWDAMLELIRIRREDKAEKKRLERLGLLPPKEKCKSKKAGTIIDSGPSVANRWAGDTVSIMDIEYNKKGSVREWDMGKEGI